MSELLPPTWQAEDLPVLLASVELIDEQGRADWVDIHQKTGIAYETIARALRRLDGEYVDANLVGHGLGPEVVNAIATRVTPKGRRASGQWPDERRLAEELLARLELAAEEGPPEKRKALRRFVDGAKGEGAEFVGGALGAALVTLARGLA